MNLPANDLAGLVWSQIWQVTALAAFVGVATRLFCRRRPHLAYMLWMLVLLKCLTPPLWSSPTGVFSWVQPHAAVAMAEAPLPAADPAVSHANSLLRSTDCCTRRSDFQRIQHLRAATFRLELKRRMTLRDQNRRNGGTLPGRRSRRRFGCLGARSCRRSVVEMDCLCPCGSTSGLAGRRGTGIAGGANRRPAGTVAADSSANGVRTDRAGRFRLVSTHDHRPPGDSPR